ncbi:MAG: hypothetical protein DRN71_00050 [Candidatus Nanohalarchaeota archaeon]|nr:MAG: hypothetical protein DRN71_00050 [Candidatus Nanohaloarchaeota archaeon]
MFTSRNSSKSVAEKMPLDIQKKSVEIEIEKKVIILENSLDKLKESIKATSEIKDLKESLARLAQIQEKLREMEDLELITKLETIQAQDEILKLTDDMETLQGKMKLLSGAIKMISTKITAPDAKRDTTNFEKSISSLKSELDSIKKIAENQSPKNNASKMIDLERKYNNIDTEFRKFVSTIKSDLEKRDNKFKSMLSTRTGSNGSLDKAEIDAVKAEIATLKDVVDKVESLVKASRKGAKEFESRISENNEKTLRQLGEQAKIVDGFRVMDKKLVTVLDSKIRHMKQDIARSLLDTNKEEIDKLTNEIAGCKKNTGELEEKIKLLDKTKTELRRIREQDAADKLKLNSMNNQLGILNDMKKKIENLEHSRASSEELDKLSDDITACNTKNSKLAEKVKLLEETKTELRRIREQDAADKLKLNSMNNQLGILNEMKKKIENLEHSRASSEELDKLSDDITACNRKNSKLAKKVKLLDEIKAEVEQFSESIEDQKKRLNTLDHTTKLLNKLKSKSNEFEGRFSDIDNMIASMQSVEKKLSRKLDSRNSNGADYIKYIPVLKENVSKLYQVHNRTEKRITDIENHVANNKDYVKDRITHDVDSAVNKTVTAELSDVVENINTLSTDIKSKVKNETLKQKVLMYTLRNEFNAKLLPLKKYISDTSKKTGKSKSESHNYEEFAEFKAKILSDINELKNNIKKSEKKVNYSEVEDLFDNKLMPHVSNQNKIAKSVALLNRKLEQRHLEVSKSAHEKIKTTVNPIVERLSQIESDIILLKDTKTELADDVKTILENYAKKEEKSGANSNDNKKMYDEKLKNLTEKIEMIQSGNGMTSDMLERKMRAVQNESEVLRQELEKIKGLYFEMFNRDKNAPVIIE